MQTLTIKSRKFDAALTFTCHSTSDRDPAYVKLNRDPIRGIENIQPCAGGSFRGETLTATTATFERVVRGWYKQFATKH